ncbi:MAG TPA: DUF6084 family protein [Solirubrobacteraceae bacterium]|nr:DUF6084 family protein [Solirubrobacteraceae bacterium]
MSAVATQPGAAQPQLAFSVLGVRPARHSAAPLLILELEVSEDTGTPVYMIALSIQLMIEPARRAYDDEARERLVELFGAPERWAVTTRSLLWSRLDVLVGPFTGSTVVPVPVACHYDLELAAARYLHSLPEGVAPLALHFNGTVYYRDACGGLRIVLVPWTQSIDYRMPVSVWREAIEHHYADRTWIAVSRHTYEALARAKRQRGLATMDAAVAQLLCEAEHRDARRA